MGPPVRWNRLVGAEAVKIIILNSNICNKKMPFNSIQLLDDSIST